MNSSSNKHERNRFAVRMIQAIVTSLLLLIIDFSRDQQLFWSIIAVSAILVFVIVLPAIKLLSSPQQ